MVKGTVLAVTQRKGEDIYSAIARTIRENEEDEALKQVYAERERTACCKPSRLNFSQALLCLKEGGRVAREGWNGKGQYIELATKVSYVNSRGDTVNVDHRDMGNKAIAFVGTSGVQLGWLASQSDLLSEDWVLVK